MAAQEKRQAPPDIPSFLEKYKKVLKLGGQIHFKTDNGPLFQFSLEEFQALDFPVQAVTWNLHENGLWVL